MKEFLVYTGLRLALFAVAFLVVTGIWLLLSDDGVFFLWPLIIAAVLSAVGSIVLLRGPRERFAAVVEARASRMVRNVNSSGQDSD